MVSCLDVDANKLIESVAVKLEQLGVEKPEFVNYVKSGAHAERPPAQENFWYLRCASIMRQTHSRAHVGTNKLRRHYGGRKDKGVKPEKHRAAGGAIIRRAMQSLEKSGFLVMRKLKEKGKEKIVGRELTPKGLKLLDQCAKEVKQ